ncbi:MAG: WD40 repeat domain-containing protein [Pirellulales bacterium]|nr:WD40 repeat domain-containing protein [Pirellulales bacterium]
MPPIYRAFWIALAMQFLLSLNFSRADDVVLRIPEDDPNENSDIVRSVAFSPDGQVVAAGYGRFIGLLQAPQPGQAILWDSRTGKRLASLLGYRDGVSSVVFSPDGKLLATAGFAGDIKIWDPHTRKVIRDLRIGRDRVVLAVTFSSDGTRLAAALWTGENEGQAWVWDVATGKITLRLAGHTDLAQTVAFSPDGKLLASGSMDATARLWDLATGQIRAVLTCPEVVKLAEARFRELVPESHRYGYEPQPDVTSVIFSPDGKTLAAVFTEWVPKEPERLGVVKLWDVATGKPRTTLAGLSDAVGRILYSPDGKLLAATTQEYSVSFWNTETLKEVGSMKGSWPIAFSPDGSRLVLCADDADLRVTSVAAHLQNPAQ